MSSVFMVFRTECTSQLLPVNIYSLVIFGWVLFYPAGVKIGQNWVVEIDRCDQRASPVQIPKGFGWRKNCAFFSKGF